jgi:HEAT repeat protein
LAHLVAVPEVRSVVRHIHQPRHLVPDPAQASRMTAPSLRALPRWLRALHLPRDRRVEALSTVTAADDRVARLLALRAIMAEHDRGEPYAAEPLAAMTRDADPAIAVIALRHLMRHEYADLSRLLLGLIDSPHDRVRRIAEQQVGRVGFDRLWRVWPRLDRGARRSAGLALLKIDRDFHRQLAHRMADRDPEVRFQAVMMARELDQETYFEHELGELVRDESTRVASAAVRGLGAIPDSTIAADVIERALEHPDDRVRANAVEAIERLDRLSHVRGELQRLSEGRGNRSRANAIKAMMTLPMGEALDALRSMLADEDPRHRVSALWVVDQLGLPDVAQRLVEMSRDDRDADVRRRALRVARRLADRYGEEGSLPYTGAGWREGDA